MSNIIDSPPYSDKSYHCDVCNKDFDNYKMYWKHMNRKTACVSSKEIIEQIQSKDSRINYFKAKFEERNQELERNNEELEKREREIEYLKNLLSRNEDNIEKISDKLDLVQDSIDNKNNTFTCNQFQQINNLTNENKNNVINIEFAEPKKEKLDHITQDMMMNILNQKSYNVSVGKLIQSIYFHPKAPENWNWCVTDCDLQLGVLRFDHESGNLQRDNTEQVIQKQYANVMFRVVDMLDELRRERNLNRPQAINCSRLCNSLGTKLDSDQVSAVKEVAYQGRNLSKSLWDYLDIMVETTTVPTRITLKQK
jgi:hypothetical protein